MSMTSAGRIGSFSRAAAAGAGAFAPFVEDNAIGEAGMDLRTTGDLRMNNTVQGSVFWIGNLLLQKAQERLAELERLKSNWDSYGAPAPNDVAIRNAAHVLELMQPFDLAAANIAPSAEGGIGFFFEFEDRYADLEFSNDGEILGVRYAGMETPVLIQTDGSDNSIKAAIAEVRNYIGT